MKRIAFYGGSFDPLHNGHLTIARKLTELFAFDEFVFIPAFQAPHKKDKKTTSAFHRFAMLALATSENPQLRISKIELDAPEKPYTVETQTKLKEKLTDTEIFFVIGADSWLEIDTWREWQLVLTLTNIIVVTRPRNEISFAHVTEKIRERIIDLRSSRRVERETSIINGQNPKIYITDAVNLDISSTEIRRKKFAGEQDWNKLIPRTVAKYIEKYEIYR